MGRRDGLAHKPSPESLLFICKDLQVEPAETLIVGDTELDIQCGKNAGAKTCGVIYGYRKKEQIVKEKPDLIISDLEELIKESF
jgi:phosphoglycolate phosphatase-like HAD superfamily hydrolase